MLKLLLSFFKQTHDKKYVWIFPGKQECSSKSDAMLIYSLNSLEGMFVKKKLKYNFGHLPSFNIIFKITPILNWTTL